MDDWAFERKQGRRRSSREARPPADATAAEATAGESAGSGPVVADGSLPAAARSDAGSRNMLDVLALPDGERQVEQWLLRHGDAGITEIATHLGQSEAEARVLVDALAAKGFLERSEKEGEARWHAHLAAKPARPGRRDLWKALDD
jgi:hypothetical protein